MAGIDQSGRLAIVILCRAPDFPQMSFEPGKADTRDGGWRPGEAEIHYGLIETQDVEEMRSAVAVKHRDAHFGHDFR